MPTYDYYCETNDQTIEAFHSVSRTLETWGELCECAEISPGDTPPASPVAKLLAAGLAPTRANDSLPKSPVPARSVGGCGGGCACHG
jgi:hypothetical protein